MLTVQQPTSLTQLEFYLDDKPPGAPRPGGRTARTRAAVLRAVLDELTLTYSVIVRTSAKTTYYRRWGGLDGLLADLMSGYAAQQIPVPDEGDLGAALRALAREVVASLQDPALRAAFTSIVAASVQDPAARDVLSRFVAARTALMTVVVDRAVQRVEVPTGTDAAGVIQIVTAQIYYGLFLAGEQPSQAIADRAAATAAAAARAGGTMTMHSR